MKTKHTPGPWTYSGSDRDIRHRDQLHGGWPNFGSLKIATVNTPANIPLEECDANAQLIAAAPCLLAALRTLLDDYITAVHGGTGEDANEDPKLQAAYAAIARASSP